MFLIETEASEHSDPATERAKKCLLSGVTKMPFRSVKKCIKHCTQTPDISQDTEGPKPNENGTISLRKIGRRSEPESKTMTSFCTPSVMTIPSIFTRFFTTQQAHCIVWPNYEWYKLFTHTHTHTHTEHTTKVSLGFTNGINVPIAGEKICRVTQEAAIHTSLTHTFAWKLRDFNMSIPMATTLCIALCVTVFSWDWVNLFILKYVKFCSCECCVCGVCMCVYAWFKIQKSIHIYSSVWTRHVNFSFKCNKLGNHTRVEMKPNQKIWEQHSCDQRLCETRTFMHTLPML